MGVAHATIPLLGLFTGFATSVIVFTAWECAELAFVRLCKHLSICYIPSSNSKFCGYEVILTSG